MQAYISYIRCLVSIAVASAALCARTRAPRSKFRQISPNLAPRATVGRTEAHGRPPHPPQRVRGCYTHHSSTLGGHDTPALALCSNVLLASPYFAKFHIISGGMCHQPLIRLMSRPVCCPLHTGPIPLRRALRPDHVRRAFRDWTALTPQVSGSEPPDAWRPHEEHA